MTEIDWSKCTAVESVPGRCSGAWVAKDSRVMVEGILDNAEDASAEEVADMFELPVEQVRRILLFAYTSELNSLTEAHMRRPDLPRAYYYRVGVLVKNVSGLARALRPPPTRKGGTTMTAATAHPETIYIEPICDRCKHYAELGPWWDTEEEAGCVENDCPHQAGCLHPRRPLQRAACRGYGSDH